MRERLLDISAALSGFSLFLSLSRSFFSLSLFLSVCVCPGRFLAINVRKMQRTRVSGFPSANPTYISPPVLLLIYIRVSGFLSVGRLALNRPVFKSPSLM